MLQLLWEKAWKFVIRLTTVLPYQAAVPLVGIYLKEVNTCLQEDLTKNHHSSFIHNKQKLYIAQLYIIKNRNKLQNIHPLEFSTIKTNKHVWTSQTLCWVKALNKKSAYCVLVQKVLKQEKLIYSEKMRTVFTFGWNGEKLIENRHEVNFLSDNHILYLDRDWCVHLSTLGTFTY